MGSATDNNVEEIIRAGLDELAIVGGETEVLEAGEEDRGEEGVEFSGKVLVGTKVGGFPEEEENFFGGGRGRGGAEGVAHFEMEEWEKFKWGVLVERVEWLEGVVWEIRMRRDQGVMGSGMDEIERESLETIERIYMAAKEFVEQVVGAEGLWRIWKEGVERVKGKGWCVGGEWVRGRGEEWEEEVAEMLMRELVFLEGGYFLV